MEKMPWLHCERCNHDWKSRIVDPCQCPKCHSYLWDQAFGITKERCCPTGDYPNTSQRVVLA